MQKRIRPTERESIVQTRVERLNEIKQQIKAEKAKYPDGHSHVMSDLNKKLLREGKTHLTEDEKNNAIDTLMNYAYYIKMEAKADSYIAKNEFIAILSINPINAAAHYRLGFIYYKEHNWFNAITHFHKAIEYHPKNEHFELEVDQLIKAKLFISYCSIRMAFASLKQARKLEQTFEDVPVPEGIGIEDLANKIEMTLKRSEYILIENGKRQHVSKIQCENLAERQPEGHIFLYFSDSEIYLFGHGVTTLPKKRADYLKFLLENSSLEKPIRAKDISTNLEDSLSTEDTITSGNLRIIVSRLNEDFGKVGYCKAIVNHKGVYIPDISYKIAYREDNFFDSSLIE
ncbi:lipopolysaccharide assembly protein LapB [Paenisporosarcina sp. TG20]|uniref:tetratricopeptide repeat protein n=1 Tax=Paenisporosarcina sp. TG20 TaxID=1211706 RepID=UPI0003080525|nr:tetratricopeptide repeat protein [Paenisporosarcina sp. TG20]